MSSIEYYNNLVSMNEIFYESHKRLIERICIDLDVTDRIDELIEKYTDNRFKLKHKKDPNKPKRYGNPYTLFCNENRQSLFQNKKVSFSEMNKQLGSAWSETTDIEKKKFLNLSEKDKARYEDEMENYNKSICF